MIHDQLREIAKYKKGRNSQSPDVCISKVQQGARKFSICFPYQLHLLKLTWKILETSGNQKLMPPNSLNAWPSSLVPHSKSRDAVPIAVVAAVTCHGPQPGLAVVPSQTSRTSPATATYRNRCLLSWRGTEGWADGEISEIFRDPRDPKEMEPSNLGFADPSLPSLPSLPLVF
eukprot:s2863_g7.t1